jgi:hypothetical protein
MCVSADIGWMELVDFQGDTVTPAEILHPPAEIPRVPAGKGREGKGTEGKKKGREKAASADSLPVWLTSQDGFSQDLWGAWMDTRKKKRAATKGKAIELLLKRLAKRKSEAVKAVEMAVESGWTGFQWDWYDNRKPAATDGGAAKRSHDESQSKQRAELIESLADLLKNGEGTPGALKRCTREVRATYGQDAVAEAERMAGV